MRVFIKTGDQRRVHTIFKKMTVIAIILLSFIALVSCLQPKYQHPEEWQLWKTEHGKSYESQREELERHLVWLSNREYINAHNKNAEEFGFIMSMNQFSDRHDGEFAAQYLTQSSVSEPENHQVKKKDVFNSEEWLGNDKPKSVDWRQEGIISPVRDQGQCGASYAFTVAAAIESVNAMATGQIKNLSVQNIIDCSISHGNQGCQFGSVANAFKYVITRGGIDTEDTYPYVARQSQCSFSSEGVGAHISSVIHLTNGSETDLKTAVAYVGPVTVNVDASDKAFIYYRSGVYSSSVCSRYKLNHSMIVVGYGTHNNSVDYWIVKNSWGTNWGVNGYIYMSRNLYNQCGIATSASYPII